MSLKDKPSEPLAGLSEKRREVGGGLFGRQKGKRLRDEQQGLMETLLPQLQIENIQPVLDGKAVMPIDLVALFANPKVNFIHHDLPPTLTLPHTGRGNASELSLTPTPSPCKGESWVGGHNNNAKKNSSELPLISNIIHLEIGFGGSEHLIHRALESPTIGFIGIEPFVNGVAKAVAEIARRDIHNIRLHHGDAVDVLASLPDGCISRLYLLYPDPWPKRRQRKRRFVSMPTLKAMHRVLKPQGQFYFASDIDDYVGWTLGMVKAAGLFEWQAETVSDWQTPYENWPGTRYEAKAYREGRVPSYLRFVKS